MAIPRVRTIIREDVPGAPDWIEYLLTLLNRGFTDVSDVLDHGLTVADNTLAEVKTITVKMPNEFPAWHFVGATGEIPFLNGWVAFSDPTFGRVGHRMWPDGVVELQGMLQRTGIALPSIMFQLPVGWRPPINLTFAATANDGANKYAEVRITTAGDVLAQAISPAYSGIPTYVTITNIRFQAVGVAAKADTFAKPFPIAISTSGRFPIADCRAMRVVDRTDKSRGVLGPAHVIWEPNGTGLTINAIWGLQPGRTYDIDLLLSAG